MDNNWKNHHGSDELRRQSDTRDHTHLCFPAMMSHNLLHTPDYQVLNEMNETATHYLRR